MESLSHSDENLCGTVEERKSNEKDETSESSSDEDQGTPGMNPEGTDGIKKTFRKIFQKPKETKSCFELPSVEDYYKSDCYNFTNKNRGLAVIINNEKFKKKADMDNRPGSKTDASSLKKMFRHLGFTVKLYNNLNTEKMMTKLKKAAQEFDHVTADCFACAILSHGDYTDQILSSDTRERQDMVFGVDGVPVLTRDVLELFNDFNCPQLTGKPRLFFIQACRGCKYDDGVNKKVIKDKGYKNKLGQIKPFDKNDNAQEDTPKQCEPEEQSDDDDDDDDDNSDLNSDVCDEDETDAQGSRDTRKKKTTITLVPTPLYRDFLVMYASPPGYYAWRRTTGTWFITCLTEMLTKSKNKDVSLTRVLTQVSRKVALFYESNNPKDTSTSYKKQVPCLISMLTKDIYFADKPK